MLLLDGNMVPNPLNVHQEESLLLVISLCLGIASSVAIILTAIYAYRQWKLTKRDSKVKLIGDIREKLYEDKEIQKFLLKIDYGQHWYDEKFHESVDSQIIVDKTLSIYEYVCYLVNEKMIGEKEFELIKYDVDRILRNEEAEEYLYNLYHWCINAETRCSYANLIDYALKNDMWESNFTDKYCTDYPAYLNFR